jgi:hypothetical protein
MDFGGRKCPDITRVVVVQMRQHQMIDIIRLHSEGLEQGERRLAVFALSPSRTLFRRETCVDDDDGFSAEDNPRVVMNRPRIHAPFRMAIKVLTANGSIPRGVAQRVDTVFCTRIHDSLPNCNELPVHFSQSKAIAE